MQTRRTIFAILASAALVLAACGPGDQTKLEQLQESGSITIGVANEVPYGFVGDDGEPAGIAPDVAKAVLAELGITDVQAEVVEFGELIGGLQAGQFDMITAGMYITPDRAEQIYFSDPDYCIQESLAVAPGNPHGIVDYSSIVDNPDLTVAVAAGVVNVDYVRWAGIPDEQVEVFGDIDSQYRALEAGEVDAVTGTAPTVAQYAAASPGIDAVEPFLALHEDGEPIFSCGGHGFADEEFRDAFNEVLGQLRADGTTIELITAYEGFTEDEVTVANELTLQDMLD